MEKAISAAALAGWKAARISVYAVCEDMQSRPFSDGSTLRGLGPTPTQEAHAKGFNSGYAYAAKCIARTFAALGDGDDDNLAAVIAALQAPDADAQ